MRFGCGGEVYGCGLGANDQTAIRAGLEYHCIRVTRRGRSVKSRGFGRERNNRGHGERPEVVYVSPKQDPKLVSRSPWILERVPITSYSRSRGIRYISKIGTRGCVKVTFAYFTAKLCRIIFFIKFQTKEKEHRSFFLRFLENLTSSHSNSTDAKKKNKIKRRFFLFFF